MQTWVRQWLTSDVNHIGAVAFFFFLSLLFILSHPCSFRSPSLSLSFCSQGDQREAKRRHVASAAACNRPGQHQQGPHRKTRPPNGSSETPGRYSCYSSGLSITVTPGDHTEPFARERREGKKKIERKIHLLHPSSYIGEPDPCVRGV